MSGERMKRRLEKAIEEGNISVVMNILDNNKKIYLKTNHIYHMIRNNIEMLQVLIYRGYLKVNNPIMYELVMLGDCRILTKILKLFINNDDDITKLVNSACGYDDYTPSLVYRSFKDLELFDLIEPYIITYSKPINTGDDYRCNEYDWYEPYFDLLHTAFFHYLEDFNNAEMRDDGHIDWNMIYLMKRYDTIIKKIIKTRKYVLDINYIREREKGFLRSDLFNDYIIMDKKQNEEVYDVIDQELNFTPAITSTIMSFLTSNIDFKI